MSNNFLIKDSDRQIQDSAKTKNQASCKQEEVSKAFPVPRKREVVNIIRNDAGEGKNMKFFRAAGAEMIQKKFETQFKFYMARPVNELLANAPTLTVAQFKEWLFLDDSNQYMKRVYQNHEQRQRIQQLTNLYKQLLPPFSPSFFQPIIGKVMLDRRTDMAKLFVHRVYSQQLRKQEQQQQLDQQKLREIQPEMEELLLLGEDDSSFSQTIQSFSIHEKEKVAKQDKEMQKQKQNINPSHPSTKQYQLQQEMNRQDPRLVCQKTKENKKTIDQLQNNQNARVNLKLESNDLNGNQNKRLRSEQQARRDRDRKLIENQAVLLARQREQRLALRQQLSCGSEKINMEQNSVDSFLEELNGIELGQKSDQTLNFDDDEEQEHVQENIQMPKNQNDQWYSQEEDAESNHVNVNDHLNGTPELDDFMKDLQENGAPINQFSKTNSNNNYNNPQDEPFYQINEIQAPFHKEEERFYNQQQQKQNQGQQEQFEYDNEEFNEFNEFIQESNAYFDKKNEKKTIERDEEYPQQEQELGSFARDLLQAEYSISFESATHDIYNPSFSQDEYEQAKQQKQEEYVNQFKKIEKKFIESMVDANECSQILDEYVLALDFPIQSQYQNEPNMIIDIASDMQNCLFIPNDCSPNSKKLISYQENCLTPTKYILDRYLMVDIPKNVPLTQSIVNNNSHNEEGRHNSLEYPKSNFQKDLNNKQMKFKNSPFNQQDKNTLLFTEKFNNIKPNIDFKEAVAAFDCFQLKQQQEAFWKQWEKISQAKTINNPDNLKKRQGWDTTEQSSPSTQSKMNNQDSQPFTFFKNLTSSSSQQPTNLPSQQSLQQMQQQIVQQKQKTIPQFQSTQQQQQYQMQQWQQYQELQHAQTPELQYPQLNEIYKERRSNISNSELAMQIDFNSQSNSSKTPTSSKILLTAPNRVNEPKYNAKKIKMDLNTKSSSVVSAYAKTESNSLVMDRKSSNISGNYQSQGDNSSTNKSNFSNYLQQQKNINSQIKQLETSQNQLHFQQPHGEQQRLILQLSPCINNTPEQQHSDHQPSNTKQIGNSQRLPSRQISNNYIGGQLRRQNNSQGQIKQQNSQLEIKKQNSQTEINQNSIQKNHENLQVAYINQARQQSVPDLSHSQSKGSKLKLSICASPSPPKQSTRQINSNQQKLQFLESVDLKSSELCSSSPPKIPINLIQISPISVSQTIQIDSFTPLNLNSTNQTSHAHSQNFQSSVTSINNNNKISNNIQNKKNKVLKQNKFGSSNQLSNASTPHSHSLQISDGTMIKDKFNFTQKSIQANQNKSLKDGQNLNKCESQDTNIQITNTKSPSNNKNIKKLSVFCNSQSYYPQSQIETPQNLVSSPDQCLFQPPSKRIEMNYRHSQPDLSKQKMLEQTLLVTQNNAFNQQYHKNQLQKSSNQTSLSKQKLTKIGGNQSPILKKIDTNSSIPTKQSIDSSPISHSNLFQVQQTNSQISQSQQEAPKNPTFFFPERRSIHKVSNKSLDMNANSQQPVPQQSDSNSLFFKGTKHTKNISCIPTSHFKSSNYSSNIQPAISGKKKHPSPQSQSLHLFTDLSEYLTPRDQKNSSYQINKGCEKPNINSNNNNNNNNNHNNKSSKQLTLSVNQIQQHLNTPKLIKIIPKTMNFNQIKSSNLVPKQPNSSTQLNCKPQKGSGTCITLEELGDCNNFNNSYGFLTSRSASKPLKQKIAEKFNIIDDSPYTQMVENTYRNIQSLKYGEQQQQQLQQQEKIQNMKQQEQQLLNFKPNHPIQEIQASSSHLQQLQHYQQQQQSNIIKSRGVQQAQRQQLIPQNNSNSNTNNINNGSNQISQQVQLNLKLASQKYQEYIQKMMTPQQSNKGVQSPKPNTKDLLKSQIKGNLQLSQEFKSMNLLPKQQTLSQQSIPPSQSPNYQKFSNNQSHFNFLMQMSAANQKVSGNQTAHQHMNSNNNSHKQMSDNTIKPDVSKMQEMGNIIKSHSKNISKIPQQQQQQQQQLLLQQQQQHARSEQLPIYKQINRNG